MNRNLILAVMLIAPCLVHAQGIDMSQGGPVDVTATNGLEYDRNANTVTARGDARAVRGDVTVTADQLIAHLRRKSGTVAAAAKTAAPTGAADTGANEIYRLEAVGNVHIFTPTDHADGADHGVYDIDQSVLVLTGPHLVLVTPQQVLTARDAMEYWSQAHRAVGRGHAVVTTQDGRQITADTLVGYTVPNDPPRPGDGPAKTPTSKQAIRQADGSAKPGGDAAMAGKLQRVEAFGHVTVRTATEIVTGDRGVYVPDTGIARIAGNVHITRGLNQLNGAEAVVNMHTGISTLTQGGDGRVHGLIVPNSQPTAPTPPSDAPKSKAKSAS